jgi:hypothetical protein
MMNDKITWKTLVHKVCRLCLSGDLSGDRSSLSEVDEAFVSCKVPATYLDCRRIRMSVSTLRHVLPHHEQDKKAGNKTSSDNNFEQLPVVAPSLESCLLLPISHQQQCLQHACHW